MTKLHPGMPIHQRTSLIADALARVLDRGPEMSVEPTDQCSFGVWVIRRPYDDSRVAHEIDTIARELEMLL